MHKILQTHLLRGFVANLKIDTIYALYPESFCDKNLAIWKVFAFSDSDHDLHFALSSILPMKKPFLKQYNWLLFCSQPTRGRKVSWPKGNTEDNFAKRKNVGPARTFGPPAPSDFRWCSWNSATNELADNNQRRFVEVPFKATSLFVVNHPK